jgi:hypothetical protein
MEVKQKEDNHRRQAKEIRELNGQLKAYIDEITLKESEMRMIVKQNNEFIATNCVTTKIVDRNIRIERIVPQIHEKIVEVERIIERPSRDLILALTEKEKSELRKSVKEEYRQRLKEMEANILAYQELLL